MPQTHGSQDKGAKLAETDVPSVIVVSVDAETDKKRRKKKGNSSREARRFEDIENRASQSLHRVSKAVNTGVETYLEKRDSSQRKRKDGALVDILVNSATGVSKAVSDSAPVVIDLAKAFTTNRRKKRIRQIVRNFPMLF